MHLTQIAEALANKRAEIEARMGKRVEHDNEPGDEADHAVELHNLHLGAAQNAHDAKLLREVIAAQDRWDQGPLVFGVCIDCDQRIPRKRLDIVPESARCRPCQEAHEEALKYQPAEVDAA